MKTFDCLAPETAVLGPHFLEASAGTGKTFAVEHIVARLLLSSIQLEQILVVTFTRAAARELKLRIRSNLQGLIDGAGWGYLNGISLTPIKDALGAFDRCQIFTIHGFCHRMLREFSFEAGISSLKKEELRIPSLKREAALRDFFEFKLTNDIISAQQLEIVLKWAGSVEDLARKLKKEEPQNGRFWPKRFEEFCSVVAKGPTIDPDKLKEDWESLRGLYKKKKGDLDAQVDALGSSDFNLLIEEKGTLFEFLAADNKKMKAKDPTFLHYPGYFEWAGQHLFPLIQSASDPKEIFDAILTAWKPIDKKVLEEEGSFGPDDLLLRMQSSMQIDSFRKKVQGRYRAVLIDEFQDTDPVQWDIFEKLFLSTTEAIYLIGDPKQSIYRFRKADLYTYLKAKESIPPEGHFYLDTNFRSSKQLIGALNALFDREWLHLPKEKKNLPYLPVKAGLDLATSYPDEKGAIHFALFEAGDKHEPYRYIAREILRLKLLSNTAILVKDRYEAVEMQEVLTLLDIPSSLKSQNPLSETLAFKAIVELFQALQNPRHLGKAKTVLAGPFGGYSAKELLSLEFSPLAPFSALLEERGLATMLQFFSQSVKEKIASYGPQFCSDFYQVLEIVFEWEQSVGFSFDEIFRFFDFIQKTSPEDAILQRKEEEIDGVQIMTMHASKGLEFEVVFALGLGKRTHWGDEETEAEKQRLLYVAMTRAKTRLYIPIRLESKEAEEGTLSPIETFAKCFNGAWEQELQRLSESTSLTVERVDSPIFIEPANLNQSELPSAPILKIPPYQPSYLLSFTSLAKDSEPEQLEPLPEGHLPRGTETGVIIHRIFERVFTENDVERIVNEELAESSLAGWENVVVQLVQSTLDLPLQVGFCLRDIDRTLTRIETEFLFENGPNYLKGFIDLIFMHQGKLYFVDWKTNWLPDYTPERLQMAVRSHQYDLQASIYKEAIDRTCDLPFGEAIYLFVRGPAALCFTPERKEL